MMQDRGVFLVPTLAVRIGLEQSKFPPRVKAKADAPVKEQDNMLRRAIAIGVKIVLGTDAALYPHGCNAMVFVFMAAGGMSAAQGYQCCELRAADLYGIADPSRYLTP